MHPRKLTILDGDSDHDHQTQQTKRRAKRGEAAPRAAHAMHFLEAAPGAGGHKTSAS